jgi:colanic acid biosynthesis glycosyl transferase WcaI
VTHILFVTPYYPPEKTPPAIRISETAQCLVQRGYQVTVLTTFPNFPSGIVPQEYRGHRVRREVRNEVNIVRVWSYITPNKGFLRRILGQLSFGCISPLFGWKYVGSPDVIIVESPPLFDAMAGRLLAWGKHCPYIFTVADLWPEVAVQLGMLRNRFLIQLAQWLEWSTYRRASLVWAVTQGIRDKLIARGLAPEHIFLLTNGVDVTRFRPIPRDQARVELGWDDRYTVLYAGTHGLVYALSTLLDAAEKLLERSDIHFVLVGDGVTRADLMRQARIRHLDNVTFLDPQPHERMPLLFASADACVIPLRNVSMALVTLPAKVFEIMACARATLLGVDGEARRLVEQEAGAAIYVEPENVDALVSAILYLFEHPEVADTLGQNGRAFVEARFDRQKLVETLEEQILKVMQKRGADPTLVLVEHAPVAAGIEEKQQ